MVSNNSKKVWRSQVSAILRKIIEENMYSEQVLNVPTTDKLFEDSCRYVNLITELRDFVTFLENSNKYQTMAQEENES